MISQETMKNCFTSRIHELEESTGSSYKVDDVPPEIKELLEFRGLEKIVNKMEASQECYNSQFSQEYIEFLNRSAEEIANKPKNKDPEESLEKLAKILASYTD